VKDIVDAVVYLTEAGQVTGEVLHVDGVCARRQMVARESSRPAGAEQRLKELGIKLPVPPEPFGTYVESGPDGQFAFFEWDASH